MSDIVPCPVCDARDISVLLEIPRLPVFCNQLCHTREAALAAPVASMTLGLCGDCGHLYNLDYDAALVEYSPDYENSLHFSSRFRAYATELAAQLTARHELRGKTIVEIGCGRADFLRALCDHGANNGIGFDPSFPGESGVADPVHGVTVYRQTYSATVSDIAPDLTCCRHCLEHIARPREFVRQLRVSLCSRPGSAVFFEVPNALFTLRDGGIWDIIYEHCGYFSASSLRRLFESTGFRVTAVEETFGRQFLTLNARPATADATDTPAPDPAVMQNHADYFARLYPAKIDAWEERLAALRHSGQRTVVWGAGSKGNTFLNLLNESDDIEYVVDINPHKQGKFVAGSGQQIVAPDFLRHYRPQVVVVMNPVYADEILSMTQSLGLKAELVCA